MYLIRNPKGASTHRLRTSAVAPPFINQLLPQLPDQVSQSCSVHVLIILIPLRISLCDGSQFGWIPNHLSVMLGLSGMAFPGRPKWGGLCACAIVFLLSHEDLSWLCSHLTACPVLADCKSRRVHRLLLPTLRHMADLLFPFSDKEAGERVCVAHYHVVFYPLGSPR